MFSIDFVRFKISGGERFNLKRQFKAVISVAMALVIGVCASTDAIASTIKELKTKQQSVTNDLNATKSQLANTITDKNNTLSEFGVLEADMEVASNNYYYIVEQLELARQNLEQTKIDLAAAQEDYDSQFALFSERIRVMYENGSTGIEYLEILLQSKSFSDFINNITIINALVEFDKSITERLKAAEETIAQKLVDLEFHTKEVETLKLREEIYMNELDAKINEKQVVLETLYQQEEYFERAIKQLEDDSQSIEKMIKEQQAAELERQKKATQNNTMTQTVFVGGEFGWPVPSTSKISSYYGNRKHPISKRTEFHKGIDIPDSKGKDVVAANAGTVTFTGNYSTYGKLVLIDHGGGITTAYAHNSSIVVKVGDSVDKGQTIAKIGSTGQSTGPHCHFEVRVNGGTQNPLNYLTAK